MENHNMINNPQQLLPKMSTPKTSLYKLSTYKMSFPQIPTFITPL